MEKIIEDFLKTDYFLNLCQSNEVIMCFIGGSRGANCNRCKSDYDIFTLTKNQIDPECRNIIDSYLVCDDISMHNTLFDIKSYFTDYDCAMTIIGMCNNFIGIIPIYINQKYTKECSAFLNCLKSNTFLTLLTKELTNYIDLTVWNSFHTFEEMKNFLFSLKCLYQLLIFGVPLNLITVEEIRIIRNYNTLSDIPEEEFIKIKNIIDKIIENSYKMNSLYSSKKLQEDIIKCL